MESGEGSSTRTNAPARCRSCRAPIVWIRTERGKMPCNWPSQEWEPPEDPGRPLTIFIKDDELSDLFTHDVYKAVRLTSNDIETIEGYESHFATCKFAKRHRRARV